uniref:Uncharacterized protein n=1 Tax=Pipistrellus kuhlii TaxID=59472 RepID=A0A7J7TAR2_PIPKU|nr:hypothetical protein mPipKuh1_009690 [Pipistrellus kuhlii]
MFTNGGKDGIRAWGRGPGATQRHTPQEHTALTLTHRTRPDADREARTEDRRTEPRTRGSRRTDVADVAAGRGGQRCAGPANISMLSREHMTVETYIWRHKPRHPETDTTPRNTDTPTVPRTQAPSPSRCPAPSPPPRGLQSSLRAPQRSAPP